MKKFILTLLILAALVSCSPYKSSYTEPERFVSNIPEVFWGNWIVDNDEFVNTMHFDIEKEHIWQWVENFEEDEPYDTSRTGWYKEDITEKSFDPSIYNPPFGDVGYEQHYFSFDSKYYTSSSSTLMLCYDSQTDRIKYWKWSSNRYGDISEYTYYLERAPQSEE